MNNKIEQKSRQEIEAHIIAKAWKDTEYKKELLSDPKSTYERELNIEFFSEVNVKVLEENSETLYFVLPECPEVNELSEELSEEQLEVIAGGKDGPYDTARRIGRKIFRLARGGCS